MAAPAVGKRRRWVPPPTARVDWSNPLAKGLVLLWTGSGVDHVTGQASAYANGAGRNGVMNTGQAARFLRTSDQYVTVARNSLNDVATNTCTVACIARQDEATPAASHMLVSRDKDTTRSYTMDILFSPPRLRFYVNGSASALAYVDPPPAQNIEFMSVGTWDGGTARIYLNGVEGVAATFPATADTSASEPWMIGRRAYPGFESPFTGDISFAAVWNRALTANDVANLYADPFQMLRW